MDETLFYKINYNSHNDRTVKTGAFAEIQRASQVIGRVDKVLRRKKENRRRFKLKYKYIQIHI